MNDKFRVVGDKEMILIIKPQDKPRDCTPPTLSCNNKSSTVGLSRVTKWLLTYKTRTFGGGKGNFLMPKEKQTAPNTELMMVLRGISSHHLGCQQCCLGKLGSMKQAPWFLSGNCICSGPMHRFMVTLFMKKKPKSSER